MAAVKQMEDCLDEVKVWIATVPHPCYGCPLCAELISSDAPMYLCELVCPYKPTRTLRSANNNMLEAEDCSFTVAAAPLWDN